MKRLTALSLALLSGCNFAPRHERPCVDEHSTWKTKASMTSTCCNERWWESLGDPILNALVLETLANNNDIKVAAWRVCQFMANYEVIRAAQFPQVELLGSAAKQRIPVAQNVLPTGISTITPHYNYDFVLNFDPDLWGLLRNASFAAYAEMLEQVENRRTVVLTLVSAIASAYVYMRELDRQLVIAEETLRSRKESLDLAHIRFEEGLTSKMEVFQAQATYDEAAATVVTLNEKIPKQENLISVLVGRAPTCIKRGETVDQFTLPCEIPAGIPSELLDRRPDILAAEFSLMAAGANVGVARAAFFPQITLTGIYGGESFQLKHLFSGASREWLIGGSFSLPVFTAGKLSAQLDETIAIHYEAYYAYRQTVLNAFKEVEDALVSHEQSKQLFVVETKRVEALSNYLRMAWYRYYEGQNDYLTVLDAERHLFEAQIGLTEAQGEVFLSLINVYKALGGGWVIDADCTLRQ